MGSLSNLYISQSYQSLIHLGTNNTASANLIGLEDGLGNSIGVAVNTAGDVSLSGSFTASLQNGYVWVGNSNGRTTTVPTSSFGGGGVINTGSLVTTASFNAYTQSTNTQLSTLFTSASLGLTTASVSGTTMTFRKGDGTTFNVTLPAGSGSVIDTGSFATTGSNTFTGQNNFSASVEMVGGLGIYNNSIFLGLPKQMGDPYDTNVGIYTPFVYAQSSSGRELILSGDTMSQRGVRVQRLFTAQDNAVVSGSLRIVPRQAGMTTEPGNLIVSDNVIITGSLTASLQQGYVWVGDSTGKTTTVPTSSFGGGGTFDSSSLVTTASFNAYTASTDNRLNNLEANSASVNVSISNLNSTTSSLNTSVANLNSFTQSQLAVNSLLASEIDSLQAATASYAISASVAAVDAAQQAQINSLIAATSSYADSASFAASQLAQDIRIDGLSAQTSSYVTESETGSFARYDVSNPWSADQTFTNISAVSASFTYVQTIFETASVIYSSGSNQFGDELTDVQTLSGSVKVQGSLTVNGVPVQTSSVDISALNQATASLQAFTQSANIRLNNLEAATSSYAISSSVAAVDAAQQAQINSLIAATSSYADSASFAASQLVQDGRLNNLESTSASVNTSIANINTFTQSADQRLDSIEAQSGSWVTSAITASSIITASVSVDDITFTKGDGSQFTIQVSTGSFALSSSYAETASLAINAKDIIVNVKNTTGAQINKGTVVRIIGATGDNPLIGTASWEDDDNSANTLGFVTANIPNDDFGTVMTQGTLLGVNTDPTLGYAAGQLVYLSGSGQYTNVKPPAPYHEVRLGQVLRAQQNNGSIYVLIQNGYELSELHDVDINTGSLVNNDLLAYNAATSQWTNKTVSGVGATTTSSFNAYTASTNNRLNSLEANSASVNTSITNLNASSASQQISIDALNVFTASQSTASLVTSIDNLNQFSASTLTSLSNLNQATSSLFGSASLALVTASFDNITRDLTFTKGDNTTFNLNIPGASGSVINTGSFLTTGSAFGTQTVFGTLQFNTSESFSQAGIVLFNTGSDASGSMEFGVTGPGNPFIRLKKRTWFQIGPRDEIYYPEFTSSFDNGIYVGRYFSPGKVGLLATSGSLGLFGGNPTANRILTNIQTTPGLADSATNLVFVNNTGTTTTIVSGSNNIWTNPINVTAGFNRYIGGSQNYFANVLPQLTGSAAFSPIMSSNFIATGMIMRAPVSSSAYAINGNVLLGFGTTAVQLGTSAVNNFERAVSGLTMNNNVIAGNLNAVAFKTPLSSSVFIANNTIGGAANLNMDSSSIALSGNTIQGTLTINNSYFPSTVNSNSGISVVGSLNIGSHVIFASGSNATFTAGRAIQNIAMIGSQNFVSASLNGDNSNVAATMLFGQALNVIGSNARQVAATMPDYGSVFVGRWNAFDGNRGLTGPTVFAVGTGNGAATRKTGFLIDSGSNTFVEGTLNVSGSTTMTGSLFITGGLTVDNPPGQTSRFTSIDANVQRIATTLAFTSSRFLGGGAMSSSVDMENLNGTTFGFNQLDLTDNRTGAKFTLDTNKSSNYTEAKFFATYTGSADATVAIRNTNTTSTFTVNADTSDINGAVNISETLKLAQQDPLPTGTTGMLAVSASLLWFYDATQWRQVSLV